MPDNPKLRAELEALSPEALETRCRRSGLSRRGTAADQVSLTLMALAPVTAAHGTVTIDCGCSMTL